MNEAEQTQAEEQARLKEAAELALAEHGKMEKIREAVEAEQKKITAEKAQQKGRG